MEAKQEDIHIIKHWLTDHQDLDTPPRFRMKVMGSFRDTLRRQLSEAVRIDLRGGGVLNSKTEDRCRVPRLVVDMEECRRKKTEEKTELETLPITDQEDLSIEMEATGRVVAASSYENKRKMRAGGPRTKRRKLEPLVDWGEEPGRDIWEEEE